jgi:ATP-dependent exoDNAse (exonuclease V) beta subunit
MTMHRAKGLQFDHVLLYGLGRTPGRRDRGVLSWFDVPGEHGNDEKIISPIGPRAIVDKDPLHQFIERTEAAKDHNEIARLLYVACTRARKSLHLLGHVEFDKEGEGIRPPRADSLLRLLWPAVEGRYSAAFRPLEVGQTGDTSPDWLTPQLRRPSRAWSLPDAGPAPGPAVPAVGDNAQAVEFYWVGTDARIAGTIVHRWLQLAVNGGIDPAGLGADRVNRSTRRWLAEAGLNPEAAAPIVLRVKEALQAMSADETGQWLLQGEGHAELELSGVYGGHIETVILDRVRVDDEGVHWIVDYKTSTHEGGKLEAFLAAEADRYRPQLRKYAWFYEGYAGVSPKCALYFPLLRKFVAVDV